MRYDELQKFLPILVFKLLTMEPVTPVVSIIIFTVLGLLFLAALIRALNALWGRDDIHQSTKILWMIFFVIAPIIGFICYMMFGGRSDFEPEEEKTV
jgi:amino acid transporter